MFNFIRILRAPYSSGYLGKKNSNQKVENDKKSRHFKLDLKGLNNLQNFQNIIDTDHSMKQSLRLLKAIESGGAGINRKNFQSTFKKYSYYVTKTFGEQKFAEASAEEKLDYLKLITSIFKNYGQISSSHLIKTFNKLSQELLGMRKSNPFMGQLANELSVLLAISKFNRLKSIAMFKQAQPRYTNILTLKLLNKQSSLLMFQLMNSSGHYNRLILQTCIDALYPHISDLTFEEVKIIASTLAYSYYPMNESFVQKLILRFEHFSRAYQNLFLDSQIAMKTHLLTLNNLAQIQINMSSSSAYLSQLDSVFHLNILALVNSLHLMKDFHLQTLCSIIRRSAYYDETVIERIIKEIMRRQVTEIYQIKVDDGETVKEVNQRDMVSINTICGALHMTALLNYRKTNFVTYTADIISLLGETGRLSSCLKRKHFSRVIWALCVLAPKNQIAKAYILVEEYFQSISEERLSEDMFESSKKVYEILNFYYCFLILKTYLPQISKYFPLIEKSLNENNHQNSRNQKLVSKISQIHYEIYKCFLEQANIPCLQQFQISNLMCDIFIPRYISQNNKVKKVVENVVIDIHGFHHFMRNCNRIKGGSQLKSKILFSEGYVYEYIPVDEWAIVKAENGREYVINLMDRIAGKYGKQLGEDSKVMKLESRSRGRKVGKVKRLSENKDE